MRYEWSKLNRLQKGSFGEYFAKMEFSMYGFLVFSAEVDDRGIDFVARNDSGKHFDVQVKTITGRNYTYISESKFFDSLKVCLVVLEEHCKPEIYLFEDSDWKSDKTGLLSYKKFPSAKEPEYGINISKERQQILRQYEFDLAYSKLL
ncbi:MAG: hypothetical protein ACYCY5_13635 [Sulfuricella sp.]